MTDNILFNSITVDYRTVSALVVSNGYLSEVTAACSLTSLIQGTRLCFYKHSKTSPLTKLSFENKELQAEYMNWQECLEISDLLMAKDNRGKMFTVTLSIVPKFNDECDVMSYSKGMRVGKEIWHVMGVRIEEGNHLCAPKKSLPNVENVDKKVAAKAAKKSSVDD